MPYCKGASCRLPSYYDKLFSKISADPKNSFFLVNYFYDSTLTARYIDRSGYRRYVFAARDSVYGHHAFTGHDKFTAGYTNDSIAHLRPAHLLFHEGKLIYIGGDMTVGDFDSLTNNHL